jgi:protein-tyrosine phosphatase
VGHTVVVVSAVVHAVVVVPLVRRYSGVLRHTSVEVEDEPIADISAHFDAAYRVIDAELSAGHSVLVHCYRGVSRSATLTAAYIMRKRGWELQQTAEHMLHKRAIVDPNEGFIAQLRGFETHLRSGQDPAAFCFAPLAAPTPPTQQLPLQPSSKDEKLIV